MDTTTKGKYLTVRWNNLIALGVGLPTLAYVAAAFSTSAWESKVGLIGLGIIGLFY